MLFNRTHNDETTESIEVLDNETEGGIKKLKACESFLKGLSPHTIEFGLGVKINQLLRKYRARKIKSIEREKQVSRLLKKKLFQVNFVQYLFFSGMI